LRWYGKNISVPWVPNKSPITLHSQVEPLMEIGKEMSKAPHSPGELRAEE
jgi:hypothetical protein